jgi:beta-glucosidase
MVTERKPDAAMSTVQRVEDLLARMTLEEKLAQLGSVWAFQIAKDGTFDPDGARERMPHGIGQITRLAGGTALAPRDVAALANEVQRFLVEGTRLGIPAVVHEESLHGITGRNRVCYPQSIGLAATWHPELVRQMADQIGRELRAGGAHQTLAPVFDITRDPRWGRAEETFGEDPYLVAAMATAYTEGVQGEGRGLGPDGVIATGKHMVGHGLPEGGLNHAPAQIGDRELRDAFLFPFEAGVRAGGLRSMMHAYDEVDGVPCVESHELLTAILRDEWGFEGCVVSDYGGIEQLISSHAVVTDRGSAGIRALEAGVDVELPSIACYGEPLAEEVRAGRIDSAVIDRSVRRVLHEKFELGLFENPYVDIDHPTLLDPTPAADRATARELAAQSIVLLENDGVLPLAASPGVVAVIGPNADSIRNLVGDYSYEAHIETLIEMLRGGSLLGLDIPAGGEVDGSALAVAGGAQAKQSILDAIRARVGDGGDVRYARGCGIVDGDDAELADAVEVAANADVAILVVGERSGLTAAATSGEARDRLELGLPGRQRELVASVAATGTPIVLVVVSGRPLGIPAEAALASAVLFAWLPGHEGPEAVADVLFGDVNPGGKLPITIPHHVGQIPLYYNHKPSGGRSHWKLDYVDGSHKPLWPFGFGRSYTTFEVRDLRLESQTLAMDGDVGMSVEVLNTGERAGDEVVQLYVRDVEASVTRPVRELRGFARVTLEPGERRRVSFRLVADQLAFTGVDGALRLEPGAFEVLVGTSSQDLPLAAPLELVGQAVSPFNRRGYFAAVEVT